VVTLSRLPGALGDEVAREVARRLGYRCFDRELLRDIAESASTREAAVANLDERDRPALTDWLCALTLNDYMSPYSYKEHLTRVLHAVAAIGEAVIVGRGAHLVLPPGSTLRVLVVAPFALRARTLAAHHGLDMAQAGRRILAEEAERRAFLRRHFGAELDDPDDFDLVLNTATLGVEGAAEAVCAALRGLPAGAAAVARPQA
jgi:cytidylate kinase